MRLSAPLLVGLLAVLSASAQTAPPDRVALYGEPRFLSGGNVAWVNFAADVGPGSTNLAEFQNGFSQVRAAGGNTMRLWLHTNGAVTPAWSASTVGEVTGPGVGTIDDIRAILDLAEDNEIGLQLCLWSFDMLRAAYGPGLTGRSRALLTDADLTQTYLDAALTPMVEALKDHPALLAWEIFNEAEGMSQEFGFDGIVTPDLQVPMADIQRFVNQTAGAIHRADPSALVTTGVLNMRALSDVLTGTDEQNYYRDDRLVAAGGDELGTLDYYNVHYYTNNVPQELSPFNRDASYWGVDKAIVVGEFFAPDVSPPSTAYGDLYTTLYDRGYAGALIWHYADADRPDLGFNWARGLENMATMFRLHRADVDVVIPGPDVLAFSADPVQILFGTSSTLSWDVEEATSVTINGTGVALTGTLAVSPTETTDYVLLATDADGLTETKTVNVDVRTEATFNRAAGQPATASSGEGGTGNADPGRAVDGDRSTRWSSAWDTNQNPEPDNEQFTVDLGAAYDVTSVVLVWEVAYGATYDMQLSLDGQEWTTVREVRDGDGDIDDLALDGAPRARFVRMNGFTRGTRFGFSLFEVEVFGLRSDRQPPAVAVTAPDAGALFDVGTEVEISVSATDADGTTPTVEIYADQEVLATLSAPPYITTWTPGVGTYVVSAVAVDGDGTRVRSSPVTVVIEDPDAVVRYEAEDGRMIGGATVESASGASGGQVVTFYDTSDIGVAWTIEAPAAGPYPVTVRYALPFGPQTQNLVVNSAAPVVITFAGSDAAFYTTTRDVELAAGANEVRVEAGGGFMTVDYIEVEVGSATPTEDTASGAALTLGTPFPNPVVGTATVPYSVPTVSHVRLAVYDAVGRRVAVLADGEHQAGPHRARFETAGLAGGVYVIRIEVGELSQTRRVAVVR